MYHPTSNSKEIAKRALVYGLMTVAVITLVVFLVLTMQGYRFSQDDGSLVQGGLVQFASRPSGARVIINDNPLGSTTSAKATLEPGEYDVIMQRKGYRDWNKTIDVRAGTVTWVNYARLIPEKLQTKTVDTQDDMADSLASPNNEWYAMLPDASSPEIVLADLQRDDPEVTTIELPETSYNADGEAHRFDLRTWSKNGRHLLVRHSYKGGQEWIAIDRENPDQASSIDTTLGIKAAQVEFLDNSGRLFYVLENGNVRRANLSEGTMSGPLISQVVSFEMSVYKDKFITYSTKADEDGRRSVGYYRDGSKQPVVVRSFDATDSAILKLEIDEYYDETYLALAHDSRIEILKGKLPTEDPVSSLKLVEEINLDSQVDRLAIKGDGRFIYLLADSQFVAYDLEQDARYTTDVKLAGGASVGWLDQYILWSDVDSTLQFYDFDGSNHQSIVDVVSGFDVTLSRNGKYVYSIGQTDDGRFKLQQTRLIL